MIYLLYTVLFVRLRVCGGGVGNCRLSLRSRLVTVFADWWWNRVRAVDRYWILLSVWDFDFG
jgi:hypothetical protein